MDLLGNIRKLKEFKKEARNIQQNEPFAEKQQKFQKTEQKLIPKQPINKPQVKNQVVPTKKALQVPKLKEKSEPTGLFKGLVFCFPLYNVQLTHSRGKAIRATVQKQQGTLYQMQDLQEFLEQLDENDEGNAIHIDFMLVDPKIPKEIVEQAIPVGVRYRGIVDFNFVFQCIAHNRILNYDQFLVPEKSKELQQYVKAKEIEQILEMESKNIQKIPSKYVAGIQPINNETNTLDKNEESLIKKEQSPSTIPKLPQKSQSFNKFIYESFQRLSLLFDKSDRGRSISYTRIANVLKTVKFDIRCQEDAEKLKGMRFIGPKTIEKIKEFVQNGSIQQLTVLEGKEENLVCRKLEKVWGIGKAKAQQLYGRGMKTVEDLRQLAETDPGAFTKNQKIGLKYYQDLIQRIPRAKVARMFEYIKSVLFQIAGTESAHKMQVCGSFRRGIQTCGDIDVIITRKDGTFENRLINQLVDQLTSKGFLTDHLAMPRHQNPKSCISYMGICKYEDQTHHRVDLKYYPVDQYAFALLYFTGSDVFNRNMRLFAMKNGYCLSDHGMWKAEKIGGNIVAQEQGVVCFTEEEIFGKLGIKYKTPQERCV